MIYKIYDGKSTEVDDLSVALFQETSLNGINPNSWGEVVAEMEVSIVMGLPENGWFMSWKVHESPIWMMTAPTFQETTQFRNGHCHEIHGVVFM